MKNNRILQLGRKAVCIAASAGMVALMVPAASLAGTQEQPASIAQSVDAADSAAPTITVGNASTGKVVLPMYTSYKLGAEASSGTLLYASSNKKVAKVTAKGVVKAVKTGTAKITVKIKGESVSKKVSVTVVKASKYKALKSINLYRNIDEANPYSTAYSPDTTTPLEESFAAGIGSVFSICAQFNPTGTSNKNLIYKSSDTSVATVSPAGVVTATGAGTAKITVVPCADSKAKKSFEFKSYSYDEPTPVSATLNCDCSLTTKAKYADLEFTSNMELADDLDMESISLSGKLQNYEVDDLVQYDSNSFCISILKTGKASSDDQYGYVALDSGAFKEDVTYGYGAVAVEDPAPTLLADSDLASYNANTGVLTIAVDLGAAQAGDNLCPQSISLPADKDGDIKIARVSVDSEDQSMIYIGFALPDKDMGEGFDKLNSCLTESGIEIAGDATNCGEDLTVTSDEVAYGKELGYETTALDFLTPYVCGAVTSVDWSISNYGDVCANLIIDLSKYSYFAEFNLDGAANVAAGVHWGNGEDETWLFGCSTKPGYKDTDTISLGLEMSKADAETYEVFNEDGTLNTELCDQLLDQNLSHQKLSLSGGMTKNALGVPMSEQSVDMYRDNPLEYDDTLSTMSLSLMDEDDDDSGSDQAAENWETVRKYAAQLLEAGGALAWGIFNPDGREWAYITGGLAGFLGFETEDDEAPTIQDVLDKLEIMDTKLTTISTNVDKINTRLNEIEARSNYSQTLNKLTTLLRNTEIYATLVSNGVTDIVKANTDSTMKSINDEQIKASEEMAAATRNKGKRYGTTAFESTMSLGNLLAGDNGLGADSVVQTYANFVGTYYNWQPETVESVALFYARVSYAYEAGYHAAYNELLSELRNPKAFDTSEEEIKSSITDLASNHKRVTQTLVGELYKPAGSDKYQVKPGTESTVYKLTSVDKDATGVLCTLNGKTYDKDTFRSNTFFDGDYSKGKSFLKKDAEDVGNLEGSTSLSAGNWETMIERMKSATSYKSLREELVAVGFDMSDPYLNQYDYDDGYALCVSYGVTNTNGQHLLVGVATRSRTAGEKGVWNNYEWHGPVVDLVNNNVNNAGLAMSASERYYSHTIEFWKWHWGSKYSINSLWVASA